MADTTEDANYAEIPQKILLEVTLGTGEGVG